MLSYFGGKNKMAEWIYEFIPKDVKTYAEPFSGSFWVYFNTKLDYSHIKNIRYNDINRYVCNLFSCSKDYNHFLSVINQALSPGGFLYTNAKDNASYKEFYKELYYDFKNNPQNTFLEDDSFNIPDYEVGMKYAFLITSAFNGCWPKSAGFSGVNEGKLKLNAFINKLKDKKYQKKLDGISSFETIDFEEFITKYDAEDTFFYLDPPYEDPKNNRLNWYGVNDDSKFGRLSHKRLADLLKQTKAKWALSYYYYDDLETWFPKDQFTWITKDFFRSSASFSDNKDVKGTELLILNYKPEHITSKTPKSEKLVDEIEEVNGGAFITSEEKSQILQEFVTKLVSSQKDIDPEIAEIVNKNYQDLLWTDKKEEEIKTDKKEENDDDFWDSLL